MTCQTLPQPLIKNQHIIPHPSRPLQHFPVEHAEPLQLQRVLRVGLAAAVVDEYGQQHHGRLQEEVGCRPEVKEEQRERGDQHRGDLTRQHVEHVVAELEDERHGQAQCRRNNHQRRREGVVSVEEAAVQDEGAVRWPQAERQRVEQQAEHVQLAVLDEDALGELLAFFQDFLVVDVGHGRHEALHQQEHVAQAEVPQLTDDGLAPGWFRHPAGPVGGGPKGVVALLQS